MTDEQIELLPCLWCDRPGTFLCDGIIGCSPGASVAVDWRTITYFSCDAPMCALHIKRVGHLRFSRRKDGRRCESIDHCPLCAADGWERSARTHEMTAAEADDLRDRRRRQVNVERRRAAMKAGTHA